MIKFLFTIGLMGWVLEGSWVLAETKMPSEQPIHSSNNNQQKLSLIFEQGFVRAMPPGSPTTAIYGKLSNTTNQTVVVTEVLYDGAHAMFHQTLHEEGIAKMRHVSEIQLPAKSSVEFIPNGMHIMLMGMTEQPKVGHEVAITLVSQDGKKYNFKVPVKK
ncbi:MAG: copper chaperone PCu(A)C [Pseudomonadota bacterium]